MVNNSHRNIEVLSPAGNFESLMAAIQGETDGVYFGIGKLNMRAGSSKNFGISDLPEVRNICDKYNIRAYLTLNTVMYDEDLEELGEIIQAAKANRLDAVIASDYAVINEVQNQGIRLHISTQTNISNIDALKFHANFADVVVLARELNLEQVSHVCQEIENQQIKGPSGELIRIETFAHGALCMAVSGKCYLSLHEKTKSANRGECNQLCRRSYILTDKDDGFQFEVDAEYLMSPKDLSTIGFLDRILDAGVSILKLEGRGRPPEYVKTVTACYKEAVRAWQAGTYNQEKVTQWENRLRSVFNRGFWEGYYLGKRTGEWTEQYGSNATKRKMLIGKGTNYFSKIEVAEFKLESNELRIGDDILIIGPTTGVVETSIKEIHVNRQPVPKAVKGDVFSIKLKTIIRRSDKLFKVVDTPEVSS
ncbi:U32 family peptidase [Bacteroidota bacterium]